MSCIDVRSSVVQILAKAGVRGYKFHRDMPLDYPGNPDIAFPKEKIGILTVSCPLPGDGILVANKRQRLRRAGWSSLVVWERDLESSYLRSKVLDRIRMALEKRRSDETD